MNGFTKMPWTPNHRLGVCGIYVNLAIVDEWILV